MAPAITTNPTPESEHEAAAAEFNALLGLPVEPARDPEPELEPEPEAGTPNPENLKNPEPPEPAEPEEPEPAEPVDERYRRLGAEGLRRLRARYADLQSRIAAKAMEDAERAELIDRLERLNPDAWLTDEAVARGIDEYEQVFESFRAVVGRPPRRRRL